MQISLALAARTVIGAATRLHDASDGLTIAATCVSLPTIDQQLVLEIASTSIAIDIVRERCAMRIDRGLQYFLHCGTDAFPLGAPQTSDLSGGMHSGQE